MKSAEQRAVARARSHMWRSRHELATAWKSYLKDHGLSEEAQTFKSDMLAVSEHTDLAMAKHIIAADPELGIVVWPVYDLYNRFRRWRCGR